MSKRKIRKITLPLSTTFAELQTLANSMYNYPCKELCLVCVLAGYKEFRGTLEKECPTFATLGELVADTFVRQTTLNLRDEFGDGPKVCFKIVGPSKCMKCGGRSYLGYSRDQTYLPRYGCETGGSFDNYGGSVHYILACRGNRRLCGNCWKAELGNEWESSFRDTSLV